MTFNDIFKSSFLENVASVSILDMVIALVLAFGLGMFIFLVAGGSDPHHHTGHSSRHLQRGPVPRHGGRTLHRPV